MIRSQNLRSGYIQDDVEEYLYQLLPERDAVVSEIEDYAAQHRVPIIGPAVARMLSLLVQVSGAKRIFEMGSAIGYSTIWLARVLGRGLLTSEGEFWKRQRSLIQPAFHRQSIQAYAAVMTRAAGRMLDSWQENHERN